MRGHSNLAKIFKIEIVQWESTFISNLTLRIMLNIFVN